MVSRHARRASSTQSAIDLDAVAVAVDVLGNCVAAAQRRGEHETDLALLHHVGRAIALAGLRSRIGDQRHAEGGAVKVGSLARVADVELDVVRAFEGEKIVAGGDRLGDRL